MEKVWFSSKELAERWCVCLSTVNNIRKRGIIPAWRPEGSRQYLFAAERVLAYEKERLSGGMKVSFSPPSTKKWRVS